MQKRKLSDYKPEEIAHFKKMEEDIRKANEAVASGGEMVLPYSREQVGELSRYQQHALVDRISEH